MSGRIAAVEETTAQLVKDPAAEDTLNELIRRVGELRDGLS
jgi:hypothetical protein